MNMIYKRIKGTIRIKRPGKKEKRKKTPQLFPERGKNKLMKKKGRMRD